MPLEFPEAGCSMYSSTYGIVRNLVLQSVAQKEVGKQNDKIFFSGTSSPYFH